MRRVQETLRNCRYFWDFELQCPRDWPSTVWLSLYFISKLNMNDTSLPRQLSTMTVQELMTSCFWFCVHKSAMTLQLMVVIGTHWSFYPEYLIQKPSHEGMRQKWSYQGKLSSKYYFYSKHWRKVTLLFSYTMEQFLLLQIPEAWNRCYLWSKSNLSPGLYQLPQATLGLLSSFHKYLQNNSFALENREVASPKCAFLFFFSGKHKGLGKYWFDIYHPKKPHFPWDILGAKSEV